MSRRREPVRYERGEGDLDCDIALQEELRDAADRLGAYWLGERTLQGLNYVGVLKAIAGIHETRARGLALYRSAEPWMDELAEQETTSNE